MSFGLQELSTVAATAKWLYDNAFDKVNSAETQYNDFGQHIKHLSELLQSLVQCAQGISRDASQGPPSATRFNLTTLLDVCGDFKSTIRESETLLKENISYGRERGLSAPLTNIRWNNTIKSEVVRFTERIKIHNTKIQFVLEPLKLQLIHDTRLSSQLAHTHLARGQDRLGRRLETKLNSIYALLSGQNDALSILVESEPLTIPDILRTKLDRAFKGSLPELEDPRCLTLKDGVNSATHHLSCYMGQKLPRSGAVEMSVYLDLIKAVYLLDKMKSSLEYDAKINWAKDLLWINYLDDLEQNCRMKMSRYTPNEPEASRLAPPPEDQLRDAWLDDFLMCFKNDERDDNDVNIGITLSSGDETIRLPLDSFTPSEDHELGLVRQMDEQLELRHYKQVKTRVGSDKIVIPVDLRKALLIPLWALYQTILGWSTRIRGDISTRTEGHFKFKNARDYYLFQQYITGYEVGFNGSGVDISIRVHESDASRKDSRYTGKFEIWHEPKPTASIPPSPNPLASLSRLSLLTTGTPRSPSRLSGNSLNPPPSSSPSSSRLHSRSNRMPDSRRQSVASIPSSISTALTASSSRTYQSSHTSPISSPRLHIDSVRFVAPAKPVLVFLVREDAEQRCDKFLLLGIELDSYTMAKAGCSSTACRTMRRCTHVTVARTAAAGGRGQHQPLAALRVASASGAEGWNLAALGKFQQKASHVDRPRRVDWVHIGFGSVAEVQTFVEKVDKVKKIWEARVKQFQWDREQARLVNVERG